MIAAALLISVCAPVEVLSPAPLAVSNGTTLAVTVAVNDEVIRTIPPHTGASIDPSDLPPLPWKVEARSPSGRVLVSLTVRPGDVQETTTPEGGSSHKGSAARVDLSCGRLDIWSGPPLFGPMPGPGTPGDCVP